SGALRHVAKGRVGGTEGRECGRARARQLHALVRHQCRSESQIWTPMPTTFSTARTMTTQVSLPVARFSRRRKFSVGRALSVIVRLIDKASSLSLCIAIVLQT